MAEKMPIGMRELLPSHWKHDLFAWGAALSLRNVKVGYSTRPIL